jgi:prepilin-type N-terminal cleavage/methylation domain-containing protein
MNTHRANAIRHGTCGGAARGFTLIEILAVILIIGILTGILVSQLVGADEAARVQTTVQKLAVLEAAIDAYANENGDVPASSFSAAQGVPNDGTNVGVEALVVALWSNGWEAGGLLSDEADELVNTDHDSSPQRLTDFPNRELLELVDDWGNPVAYFHRRDYEQKGRAYVTLDPATGEEVRSVAAAFKNPATGRFYRHTTFQLVSAGPDGRFGTDDDITTFDRD